jgi:high-affinity iron transporter
MFANFLIGLREGLEASLIVAILVAYVVKIGQRALLAKLWAGVIAALVLSFIAGTLLTVTGKEFSGRAEPTFAGLMSLAAVGLITWMIFWMATHARGIKSHLHGEMDKAIARSGWALGIVAFFAVAREGLETALFVWAGITSSGEEVGPLIGAFLGLAIAAVLGLLLYRGALHLNLGAMFMWTGVLLIVIAAGVLRYAVAELQEAAWLPGEGHYAFDFSGSIDPEGAVATGFRAILNLTPSMTWLELIVWAGYIVITLAAFIWVIRRGKAPAAAPAERLAQPVSA